VVPILGKAHREHFVNVAAILESLYPGIAIGPGMDCNVEQIDGVLRIVGWMRQEKQPTMEDLTAAEPAAMAAAARAAIRPVTRRQMLTALHRVGLLATIKGAVAASGDVELQIAFDESQEFQRNNPFLATMAQALGKTDAEVDAIFALAATL
jgi:hypothetical protein